MRHDQEEALPVGRLPRTPTHPIVTVASLDAAGPAQRIACDFRKWITQRHVICREEGVDFGGKVELHPGTVVYVRAPLGYSGVLVGWLLVTEHGKRLLVHEPGLVNLDDQRKFQLVDDRGVLVREMVGWEAASRNGCTVCVAGLARPASSAVLRLKGRRKARDEKKVALGVTVSAELRDKAKAEAKILGMSLAAYVEQALSQQLGS